VLGVAALPAAGALIAVDAIALIPVERTPREQE
jgi:hypothetical protein